jgi:branched-chain amino acid transport system ATP-binding protein
MSLKVEQITVPYGHIVAVRSISMECARGEIVALLGSNGAGKSTTLKAISGMQRLQAGKIWFAGTRIDPLSPQEIVQQGISQVPEGRQLFPRMTIMENLLVGAHLQKKKSEIRKRMEEVYQFFPILRKREKQSARSLSGGEQQMLAIGRALMSNPKLLLLDEPSLGLAPIVVKGIANIIKDLSQNKIGIVLVEQNTQVAFSLAQRGYVLANGTIAVSGDMAKLMADDYVKKAYFG